jgi:hypothetical protein
VNVAAGCHESGRNPNFFNARELREDGEAWSIRVRLGRRLPRPSLQPNPEPLGTIRYLDTAQTASVRSALPLGQVVITRWVIAVVVPRPAPHTLVAVSCEPVAS